MHTIEKNASISQQSVSDAPKMSAMIRSLAEQQTSIEQIQESDLKGQANGNFDLVETKTLLAASLDEMRNVLNVLEYLSGSYKPEE